MKTIEELQQIVTKKIDGFCRKNGDGSLYQPINYILQLGGKRMRPVLSLMAANLFQEELDESIYPAIALEVFHNFTLMHDDIMDNSPMRRGQPTVHHKWNNSHAILSGDAMLVQAYQLLLKTNPNYVAGALQLFNRTAIEVCEGQQLDMEFEKMTTVQVNDYLTMIRLKTSVLVGCAMEMGALTSGANEEDQKKLYTIGESLGMAFQLRDDYLDIFGDTTQTGKQNGGDILSDKKTYLLIRAFEKADAEDLETLNRYIGNRSHSDHEKIQAIKRIFEKQALAEELTHLAQEHYRQAMETLDSIAVDEVRKTPLRQLAMQLQHREN